MVAVFINQKKINLSPISHDNTQTKRFTSYNLILGEFYNK